MYRCKFCGNGITFIEHNVMATEVNVVDEGIDIIREEFLECIEVICGRCNRQIIEEGEYVDD